ncbi:MAG: hypothetical protein Q9161_003702 [Pseudevernia consocians]
MEPAGDWHSQAERAYTSFNWSDPSGCTTVLETTQLSKEVVGMPAAKVLPDKEEAITKINTRLFEQAMVHFKKHKVPSCKGDEIDTCQNKERKGEKSGRWLAKERKDIIGRSALKRRSTMYPLTRLFLAA